MDNEETEASKFPVEEGDSQELPRPRPRSETPEPALRTRPPCSSRGRAAAPPRLSSDGLCLPPPPPPACPSAGPSARPTRGEQGARRQSDDVRETHGPARSAGRSPAGAPRVAGGIARPGEESPQQTGTKGAGREVGRGDRGEETRPGQAPAEAAGGAPARFAAPHRARSPATAPPGAPGRSRRLPGRPARPAAAPSFRAATGCPQPGVPRHGPPPLPPAGPRRAPFPGLYQTSPAAGRWDGGSGSASRAGSAE
ncbi:translation initiation factor IF-2-like [Equus quagga]|uniref:translation initiation factor IF-2-like n=1 Tax=Equus quagga TaxID=89248 RepID=UPI001EE1A332|nr:translation initiation factor IF-2-like [Equus quagga]